MQNQIQIRPEFQTVVNFLLVCAIFLTLIYLGYKSIELIWAHFTGQIASEMNRWSIATIVYQ